MKNFDHFIGIDWSGAKDIYTPSISIAQCKKGQAPPVRITNPYHSRHWSRTDVARWILKLCDRRGRILIGIDANFGYAQEIGLGQFGKEYNYSDLWSAVESVNQNEANFYAGRYWQAHPEYFWEVGKKPDHITLPKRLTEITCGEAGYGWPESPFKLLGPKQVGKGGMAAMRVALYLKRRAGDQICIWPFENHLVETSQIVISEIYPRQFLRRCGHGMTKVNTLKELNVALEKMGSQKIKNDTYRCTNHDTDALVSACGLRMLCGSENTVPKSISYPPMLNENIAAREGWIFGVGEQS